MIKKKHIATDSSGLYIDQYQMSRSKVTSAVTAMKYLTAAEAARNLALKSANRIL